MSMVLDTPARIERYRLMTLRCGLRLEVLGITKTRPTCYTIIKKEFRLKGNKKRVYEQFDKILEEKYE